MLVLTRKTQESIQIGDEIQIVVIGCTKKRVRLGISAPGAYIIRRTELSERLHEAPAPSIGVLPSACREPVLVH